MKEISNKYVFMASLINNPTQEENNSYRLTIMSELGYDPQVVRLSFGTDKEKKEILEALETALNLA